MIITSYHMLMTADGSRGHQTRFPTITTQFHGRQAARHRSGRRTLRTAAEHIIEWLGNNNSSTWRRSNWQFCVDCRGGLRRQRSSCSA